MAKQNVGFVDQHLEKVVLGVCAAALLAVAGMYFVGDPYGGDANQKFQDLREKADRTRQAVLNAKPKPATPSDQAPEAAALKLLDRWYGPQAESLIKIARIENPSPRIQRFGPVLLPVSEISEKDRHDLAKFVAPGPPVVTSGTSVFLMPAIYDLAKPPREGSGPLPTTPVEKSWVSVAAQVSLDEQLRSFLSADYKRGEFGMLITRVHLQRKDLDLPAADWEDVDTYMPILPLNMPSPQITSSGRVDPDVQRDVQRFREMLGIRPWVQDLLARTPLPQTDPDSRKDEVVRPPIPFIAESPIPPAAPSSTGQDPHKLATQRANDWLSAAKRALHPTKSSETPDADAAVILALAAAGSRDASDDLRQRARDLLKDDALVKSYRALGRKDPVLPATEPEKLMPIAAHDLTVVPGRTYVYRIRYEVFNEFAGVPEKLKNTEDAKRLTLFSDWSPESRPIEVRTDTYIFMTRANTTDIEKQQVRVTVFKVDGRGQVSNKDFYVKIGDRIGRKDTARGRADFATNFICVDLDFSGGTKDASMVYVDANTGALSEKKYSTDRSDRHYQKLTGKR